MINNEYGFNGSKRIVLFNGEAGSGIVFHPWDKLNSCPHCGYNNALMIGNDGKDYYSGPPYQIVCRNKECNRKSVISVNIKKCKDDWNNIRD